MIKKPPKKKLKKLRKAQKRLSVRIDEDLHMKFKCMASFRRMSIEGLVVHLIKREFKET